MATRGPDGKTRCDWAGTTRPYYIEYHDKEWGRPNRNDRHLFEMLILEGAQAGLSWDTILRRRDGYRKAFANFNAKKVARFSKEKRAKLMKNPDIIRNRLKIEAATINAQKFLEVQREFGSFNKYLWNFVGGKPIVNRRRSIKELPVSTPESDALSKDLKARGFKFVGSTIMYAFMQAVGMVNDHELKCFCRGGRL